MSDSDMQLPNELDISTSPNIDAQSKGPLGKISEYAGNNLEVTVSEYIKFLELSLQNDSSDESVMLEVERMNEILSQIRGGHVDELTEMIVKDTLITSVAFLAVSAVINAAALGINVNNAANILDLHPSIE